MNDRESGSPTLPLPLPPGTGELAAAYLLGTPAVYDPHTGQQVDPAGNARPARGALASRSVGARAGLEPPRFCALCGRRLMVQVDPMGWTAQCSRHGKLTADIYVDTLGNHASEPLR
ncbi:MAG TPA: hypothetical protein H9867_03740 [Candidatus Corynebacterium gallistercoris]|uniref:Biotin synthase auxiliary protein n=1 Tax=Candidatus Corynebacterium gallistercoris TaxID=2838530 RepID=A0A9D1RWT1_9CORY|nr:hypothetical protein [Candidatus Corynebacterium gallistercoris]